MTVKDSKLGTYIVFSVYVLISTLALIGMFQLDTLEEVGGWKFDAASAWAQAMDTTHLLISNPVLLLLVPVQISFGFACSFVNYYIFGTVVADSSQLGGRFIGVLSALVCLCGAFIAIPAGWEAKAHGKTGLMIVGGVCLAAAGMCVLALSNRQLGTWLVIIPYLVMYGIGRGIWVSSFIF